MPAMLGPYPSPHISQSDKWQLPVSEATMRDTGRTRYLETESGMATMGLALDDLFRCDPHSALVTIRLTLLKNQSFRLPRMCRRVHVLSGTAWVTVAGKDITMEIGETMSFAPENDFVLISALGAPLNLEVQGDHRPCPNWLKIRCWKRFFKRCLAWGWTV